MAEFTNPANRHGLTIKEVKQLQVHVDPAVNSDAKVLQWLQRSGIKPVAKRVNAGLFIVPDPVAQEDKAGGHAEGWLPGYTPLLCDTGIERPTVDACLTQMISLGLFSGHVLPFVVVSAVLQFPPMLPGNYCLRLQEENRWLWCSASLQKNTPLATPF